MVQAYEGPIAQGYERLKALSEQMKNEVGGGAAPKPEELTIREFLRWFGYARRGNYVVSVIRNILDELDLLTVPDFEVRWIGARISIMLDPGTVQGIAPLSEQPDPTIRVGALEAANRKPTKVAPNNSLHVATTLMQMNDFSQLPVMPNERDVKGVISWKSIGARLALGHECALVQDCMDTIVAEIRIGDPLLDAIGDISQHDYVLVRGENRIITGIVTASDVTDQFVQLTGPFLLIGEIEGYLRSLVHRKFTLEEMREASLASEGGKPISGSQDLTLGGYRQLLGKEEHWNQLKLKIDRKEFVKQLDWVREKRNDVMHFNPDGLESEDTKKLENVAMFFRNLRRTGVV